MLMKMLAAGGLELLTDGVRGADEDNPGGYYEFEKVKQLDADARWVESAKGKGVKVISQLLAALPKQFSYKVVFAMRDMHEILASQKVMLNRRGQPESDVSDSDMASVFESHLSKVKKWLAAQGHIDVLYVNYSDVLRDPSKESERINQFLGLSLDERGMAASVDISMYRQRHYHALPRTWDSPSTEFG